MAVAEITLEIGASDEIRSRMLWHARSYRGCQILTVPDGNFSESNSVTIRVAANYDNFHDNAYSSDVMLAAGYDVNNDGILSDDEYQLVFQNTLIGKKEWKDSLDTLNFYKNLSAAGGVFGFYANSHMLLENFLLPDSIPLSSTVDQEPSNLYYRVGDSELSLSNGMGIRFPELQMGRATRYVWGNTSSFAESIYNSKVFPKAIVQELFRSVPFADLTGYFKTHPTESSYSTTIHNISVPLNFTANDDKDLHFALGHCSIDLSDVWITVTKDENGTISLTNFTIDGVCSDLYDFSMNWDSSYAHGLPRAGFIVQSCLKNGVRNSGEVFRVKILLNKSFSCPGGQLWCDYTSNAKWKPID